MRHSTDKDGGRVNDYNAFCAFCGHTSRYSSMVLDRESGVYMICAGCDEIAAMLERDGTR